MEFLDAGVDDGEVVGTARLSWGGNGFTERQIEEYGLDPFLGELPPSTSRSVSE